MARIRQGPLAGDPVSRRVVLQGLVVSAALCLATVAILYLLYNRDVETAISVLRKNETNVLELGRFRYGSVLAPVISDVLFAATMESMRKWLQSDTAATRRALAQDMRNMARAKRIYDQIRFIGLDGKERIRVDWNSGNPEIVPDARLQDKTTRYYVQETLNLDAGKIYFSPFDLNVENGAVESPQKPTIRIGTPVFDSAGRKRGIIVANFLGERLLDDLIELRVLSAGELWLLNADGYWLLGPPEDEWAFMYPEHRDRTFPRAYPEVWPRMIANPHAAQFSVAGDLFTYARVTSPGEWRPSGFWPDHDVRSPTWTLLTRVPASAVSAMTKPQLQTFALIAVISLFLIAVAGTAVTIHRARRVEAERSLRASEVRLRSVLESAPDAVIVSEADDTITYANPQVEALFGYRPDQLVGQSVDTLVPEPARTGHAGLRAGYAADPRIRAMGAGLELSALRADGSEVPVGISLGFADTERGRLIIATARDLTESLQRKRLIEEYNERLSRDNAALESLNQELEAFSYSVSHDLRAPLRAIDGFSQVLLEDYAENLDETGRDYATRVRNGAQRMGGLIDDLLTLSRISRADLTRNSVDLGAMARDIADGLEEQEPGRAVMFDIADDVAANADSPLIRVALDNLLNNAWKFTAGRDPARIEFSRVEVDGETAYRVRDNGVGFDMTYAGKLFGAFQRLHDARDFPGTGIGLAIVQRVIGKHGGRIWAEAETGKGASFYFTL